MKIQIKLFFYLICIYNSFITASESWKSFPHHKIGNRHSIKANYFTTLSNIPKLQFQDNLPATVPTKHIIANSIPVNSKPIAIQYRRQFPINEKPLFNNPRISRPFRRSLFRNSQFFNPTIRDSQTWVNSVPQFSEVWTPGEYEDVSAILVAWGLFDEVITDIVYWLSNLEACDVFVVVHDEIQQANAEVTLENNGVNADYVHFILNRTPQDMQDPQFWIRDFGPRTVFVNGRHAFLDFTFDKNQHQRSNDVPKTLGSFLQFPVYEFDLEFSGGNLQVTSDGHGFMTNHILHENPLKTEDEVEEILMHAFGLETLTIYKGLLPEYDGTNHIDMWLMVLSNREILVGEYLFGQPGYVETEAAVSDLLSKGYIVRRIKQKANHMSVGFHESYTNSIIVNDVVLIPRHGTFLDREAEITWQTLMPRKVIITVDTSTIIQYAGALHCVTQQIYSDHAIRLHELKTTKL